MRVRESPPQRLHVEAATPNGHFHRWGPDEPLPENVPSGLSFGTTMPGGHDTMSVTLPRKPGVGYSDLGRLTTLRAIGAGGEVRSETRLSSAPRVSGDEISVGPEARGWIAHLEDDNTAAEIYRDIDLGHWIGSSRERQNELNAAGFPLLGGFEVAVDVTAGLPSLRLHIDGHWSGRRPVAAAWYDAGPSCTVAKTYYDFAGYPDTNFVLNWISSLVDNGVTQESGDLYTTTSGSAAVSPSAPRRFFAWQWLHSEATAGGEGAVFYVDLRRLAVYGNHGLALQGTEPSAGFLASDIVADVLSRWAPHLSFSAGPSGTLRPSSFVIPHLEFREQTTPLAMLQAANRFELRPYAVWDGPDPRRVEPTFYYHDWGDRGRSWRARVAPTQLSETGPSVDRLRNGFIVSFQDVDGSTKTVGPPGSFADVEDESLLDTDPENAANQLGIRMWGPPFDMGGISTSTEAIRIGVLLKERLREADTSGEARIVGTCIDDKGVEHAASAVRAGDTIVFVDASNTAERRIVKTSYDHSSRTNTITLDAPPEGIPDLLAQLGVSVADLGI